MKAQRPPGLPTDRIAPRFAQQVVAWQRQHGRHDLPWQGTREPYRVWLSEIMLQQTQVRTVRAYYTRFLTRFPDLQALAAAPLDDVLALWSGLGYYSRARNLHRCAQAVCAEHGGAFPRTAAQLQSLPGIGASTAAAIAAFCFGERVAIFDGNVRRVLARYLGFDADLSQARHQRALQQQAQALLPDEAHAAHDMPAYTQGLMDLGATLCTPRAPDCARCPLQADCVARREGRPEAYPVRTRRLQRGAQALWLLWLEDAEGAVWLERRPVPGVWAGLHCFAMFDDEAALHGALAQIGGVRGVQALEPRVHALTHKDLRLHPFRVQVEARRPALPLPGGWVAADLIQTIGTPAPIRDLLLQKQV
ncbi:A/G-specific adenine glycosylase [Tibeticola sp.]|uniref:A/G-specific adenine glycosylase n=1 Tax=Tibeticola sp. TaxID=2005368 RepID=UPI0025F5CCA8|nr:A/G-specific adenine glycosylase [Tibeticola sp.]